MFKLFMSFFPGIAGKVSLSLMFGLVVFSGYQYVRNNNLSSDLTTANNDLEIINGKHRTLKGQYADLENEIKKLQDSSKITSDILDENTKAAMVHKEKFNAIDKQVSAKIDSIRKKFADQERSVENKKAEDSEISSVRINGLWSLFCSVEATSTQCPSK